jgi:hypothetical protein
LINTSGDLDIICQNPFEHNAGLQKLRENNPHERTREQHTGNELPTWVAEFNIARKLQSQIIFGQREIFNAGSKYCFVPAQLLGPKQEVLSLEGIVIGRIRLVVDSKQEDGKQSVRDIMTSFFGQDVLGGEQARLYAPRVGGVIWEQKEPESFLQACLRTIVLDCTTPPNMRRLHQSEIGFLSSTNERQVDYRYILTTKSENQGDHQSRRLADPFFVKPNLMFTVADNGLFLMARPHVREGDIIVVLDGGKLPMVLRQCETEHDIKGLGEVYHIIGPAYAHGFMDGEAYEAVRMGLLEKQDLLVV